jgi:hypothetical protein
MERAKKTNTPLLPFGLVEKLFIGVLLVIFGGIVLHAPLSVGFGALWPHYSLFIKSWKEILLGIGLVLGLWVVIQHKAWARFNTPLFWLIGAFALLNVVLAAVVFTSSQQVVAGLLINLRYFLFFVLVYGALVLYPQLYTLFIKVFVAGAFVVIGFAVLQLTVLPHDILKYIGYDNTTIAPYLTVDQNPNYVRINSTLRGPNPLGAYVVVVLSVLLALWLRGKRTFTKPAFWSVVFLGLGGITVLWASYSRSAVLALVAAVAIILFAVFGRNIKRPVWIALAIGALILTGSLVALRDTQFVSQVILHEDPAEGGKVNSNDGHAESLVDGTKRLLRQPLGGGIGSTGSASLLGSAPLIVENQYLFIAHETGWLGLVLFVVIYWFVLRQLWRKRRHWFALGVFASGIGLALIGLLLPVFTDDTVAIIWWGLAAIGLALPVAKGEKA